mmetsp:Transcript_5113/g.14692  ORF Transcript_5113/g.14692 Transcript_5113/m.14692 type:complete len:258 (-) Transcript_5113:826-1599(-)
MGACRARLPAPGQRAARQRFRTGPAAELTTDAPAGHGGSRKHHTGGAAAAAAVAGQPAAAAADARGMAVGSHRTGRPGRLRPAGPEPPVQWHRHRGGRGAWGAHQGVQVPVSGRHAGGSARLARGQDGDSSTRLRSFGGGGAAAAGRLGGPHACRSAAGCGLGGDGPGSGRGLLGERAPCGAAQAGGGDGGSRGGWLAGSRRHHRPLCSHPHPWPILTHPHGRALAAAAKGWLQDIAAQGALTFVYYTVGRGVRSEI